MELRLIYFTSHRRADINPQSNVELEWKIKSNDDQPSVCWNFEPWNTFNLIHWNEIQKKNGIISSRHSDRKLIFYFTLRSSDEWREFSSDKSWIRLRSSKSSFEWKNLLMNYKYSKQSIQIPADLPFIF